MAPSVSLGPIATGTSKSTCFHPPVPQSNAKQCVACKANLSGSTEAGYAAAKAVASTLSLCVITTAAALPASAQDPPVLETATVSADAAQQAIQDVLQQSERVLSSLEPPEQLTSALDAANQGAVRFAERYTDTLNRTSDSVLQASAEVADTVEQVAERLSIVVDQVADQVNGAVHDLSGASTTAATTAAAAIEDMGSGIASAADSTGEVLSVALDRASNTVTAGANHVERGVAAGVGALRSEASELAGMMGSALSRVANMLQHAGQELGVVVAGALEASQDAGQRAMTEVGGLVSARGGEIGAVLAARGSEVSAVLSARGREVGDAMQEAAVRTSAFAQEQPMQAAAAVTLAAVSGTLLLSRPRPKAPSAPSAAQSDMQGAVQLSQELASTVLGYEQQLAKVRAQADRARATAARLQQEKDETQRALEVERTTLLAMRADAEQSTRQLEAELARVQERGAQAVGNAIEDAGLQAKLVEEQSRAYVAEARAEEAALELERERSKFVRFHREATAALEMLEAEKQRAVQLENANRELQMLLQQAAQLQAQRGTAADEGLVRQLQAKVAELAEANERLRVAMERSPSQQGTAAQESAMAHAAELQQQVARLRQELEAEKLVSHQAGVQAVQAQRSMELVIASSAELMQKLEASQAVEQGLRDALLDTEGRLREAVQEAERQRERNAELVQQIDSSADKAMAAITLLQKESQTIIEGQTAAIARLTAERDEALAKLAEAEAALEAERAAVQGLKEEVRSAKQALLTSFNDITALQGELGEAQDAAAHVKDQVEALTAQISDAERSLARQVSAHLTANVKVQQLRDEAETLRAELETLAAQLMQQDEISIEVQERICLMRDTYALTVDRLEAEQSVAISVKYDVERLKTELQRLQQQAAVLRTEMDMKEQVLTEVMLEASKQLGATEGRLREAEERLGRSNEELAVAVGELEEVGQQAEAATPALRQQAVAVVAKLQGVINGVRGEMAVLQEETVKARAELTSEREARLAAEAELQSQGQAYATRLQDEQAHRETLEHRLRSLQHEYWAVKATLGAPQMSDAERLAAASVPKKVRVSEQVLRSKGSGEGLLTPGPEEDELNGGHVPVQPSSDSTSGVQ